MRFCTQSGRKGQAGYYTAAAGKKRAGDMKTNTETATAKGNFIGMSPAQWILRVVQGALIGGGAILPGISGGVLCVTFGIYQPMMALLAHPFKSFGKYYRLFIPVIIGMAIGFWGLASAVRLLLQASSAIAISLFAGLIAGNLPALFRDAGRKGTGDSSWTGFAVSIFAVYGFLAFLARGAAQKIDPAGNVLWFFFCGAVWGLSIIIPGLSSSSILLFMGLYEPMSAGISALDMGVVLPLFAGLACTALLLARLVNRLFERHYTIAYHAILGIVIASTLLIVPTEFNGLADAALCVACFAAGFAIALLMDRYGDRAKARAGVE
jgi:putative membrane protein